MLVTCRDSRAAAGAPLRAAAAAVEEQKRAPEAAPAKVDTPDSLSDKDLDDKLKGRLTEYFSVKDDAAAVEDIQVTSEMLTCQRCMLKSFYLHISTRFCVGQAADFIFADSW